MNHISLIQEELIKKDFSAILITDENNQRYACGFPFTDGFVLVSQEKAWLITDSRYIEAAQNTAGGCCEIILYDNNHPKLQRLNEAMSELRKRQSAQTQSAILAEDRKISHADYLDLEGKLGLSFSPAGEFLQSLRSSKDEAELKSMREAQKISELALEEMLSIIRIGMTEREIAAELVYRMLKHGSEGNSFDPIVVSGQNTSLPHGVPGDRKIQAGDFLTMDFGSLKNGYCSDMTRTVAVGYATEEMQNIYNIVLKAQLAGIAAAHSGIPGKEIDSAARAVIKEAGYGQYFGHGFGHSLGLDIHEAPFANPHETRIMPQNAVISAEPGIYLPGKFGVRIEDVMILRDTGSEVITKAPKSELLIVAT